MCCGMSNAVFTSPEYPSQTLVKITMLMMLVLIPVDMVNGYLLRTGLPSISIAYKIIILFLMLLGFMTSKYYKIIFTIVLVFLFYLFIHLVVKSGGLSVFGGIDWLVKFSFIIVSYFFIKKNSFYNSFCFVFSFARFSFFFLAVNFFLGFAGYGYRMYGSAEQSIGTKGFIYAGNEISVAIIISGAILQMQLLQQNEYKLFLVVGFSMLAMAALLTSKVSIIASTLIMLLFPLMKAFEDMRCLRMQKKDFLFSIFILLIMPIVIGYSVYYALYESNLISRLSYFYERMDLITLILSSRNVWAAEAMDIFFNKYSFLECLFGTGKDWFIYISENKLVEIDLIDFLMAYGLVGVLFSYGFLFYIIIKLIKNKVNNPYFWYLLFLMFLIIGMSLTSGHVINSGVAAALIGSLFALSGYSKIDGQ